MQEDLSELIVSAQNGDTEAMESLIRLFKPKVIAIAREYFLIGADADDLIQEGMIGLYKAIHSYNPEKNNNFSAFASLCIHRQLQNAVKIANRKKNAPLNSYIPINYSGGTGTVSEDDEVISLVIADENSDFERSFINKEVNAIVLSRVKDMFNYLQFRVLKKFLNGEPYSQIATECGMTKKQVDNMIQAIKKKLKTIKGEVE